LSERNGRPSDLGRDWNNVGRGVVDGLTIEAEWADVPRGGILGDGTLNLKIEDDGTGNLRIVKVSETGGGFGNSSWTPCKPG
jgi:DNA/RNA endonuclease YhcR with UshA esterase domain